jgi:hypothetical protein
MMTFDDFEPGLPLGACSFAFTKEALAEWSALFPDDRQSSPAMPPAMIAMVVMRAFTMVLHDRPRGNIHASQKFWISRLPTLNDRLTTRLSCIGKELKNGRRWLTFGTDTIDPAGELLFRGQMTTIWAT